MTKEYLVRLKEGERRELKQLMTKGSERARKLTRCRILLLADEGRSDREIIRALGVARNSIRQVRQRYVTAGLEEAINERPRPGAPKKYNGAQKAKITAIACSAAPPGHSRWSLRLLADRVVELGIVEEISHMTIERILKKTN
jgi:transposase